MNIDKRYIAKETLDKIRFTIIEMFSEGLYHEVGIRDICKKAKVSPATVYKYFGSKEELLYASISEDMSRLTQKIITAAEEATDLESKFVAFSNAFFDFYFENPAIAKIVFLNIPASHWIDKDKFAQIKYQSYLKELILSGQKEGLIAKHDPDILLEIILGAAYRLIIKWLIESGGVENPQLVITFNTVIKEIIFKSNNGQAVQKP